MTSASADPTLPTSGWTQQTRGGYVDLKLLGEDAVYRDGAGVEHVVEWVTEADVELARRVSEIAAEQAVEADPGSITAVELALDTAHAARIAPVWAALLTGSTEARGRGTIGDDVRDATGRVPILWFQDTDEHETPRQRFHIDVQCRTTWPSNASLRRWPRGAVIVDDSRAPLDHRPRRPGRQQGLCGHDATSGAGTVTRQVGLVRTTMPAGSRRRLLGRRSSAQSGCATLDPLSQ